MGTACVSLEVTALRAQRVLTWLERALSSVCSINGLGRAAHSVCKGQHPLEVTRGNIIFLDSSTWRQQSFCLGTGSNLVCSLNTFFSKT